jgi:hypothetical protein
LKSCDPQEHLRRVRADPQRNLLIRRLQAIKEERIKEIVIRNKAEVTHSFYSRCKCLKPRHQRDIKHLISIVKTHALLNLWHRETTEDLRVVVASEEDIDAAFAIWREISLSQDLNLPPYVLRLFEEVIRPLYEREGRGLKRNEIVREHTAVYGRPLDAQMLGREILPMLERGGLIEQDKDPDDKRHMLVFPTYPDGDSVGHQAK